MITLRASLTPRSYSMRLAVSLLLAPVLSAPHATRRISRASTVRLNHALRSASVARARLRDKVVAAEGPAALVACGAFLPAARRLARERRNQDAVAFAFRVVPHKQSSTLLLCSKGTPERRALRTEAAALSIRHATKQGPPRTWAGPRPFPGTAQATARPLPARPPTCQGS